MLAAASPLLAHHSWPVDMSKEITVKGTVTDYSWGNPHVMFGMDVKDASGSVQKWNVGGPSTNRMAGGAQLVFSGLSTQPARVAPSTVS